MAPVITPSSDELNSARIMNRRTFLRTGTASTLLWLARPSWAASETSAKQKRSDEDILAQAQAQIQKHRQGDGIIRVRDASGKAVPGAKLTLEQLRHEFLFGSNFFMFNRCGKPELEEAYRQRFAALLNYCTLGFYWAGYEAERGQPNYAYTDQVVAWTHDHGIICKGHPLAWDHPASSPRWLPDDPKEIERLSLARVHDLVARFKGRINFWDVVNEPTHLKDKTNKSKMADWAAAKGAVPYVTEHLQTARAANPNATLLVNDYRIEPAYYNILNALRDHGKPLFDTVGIQSHMHDGPWSLQRVQEVCDTYARLELPLHFTETTLVSGPRTAPGEHWGETTPEGEARQAEQTVKFYTTLFAQPAVRAITWWDFSDLGAWQGAASGWLRRDMSPKLVYDRLLALIKGAWWTKVSGTTNEHGEFATRAFYGTHRITVELPSGHPLTQEVHWQSGQKNHFDITL
jgi:endo-1,4-beta-xylanase